MAWVKFSSYRKRFISIDYHGERVHIIIEDRRYDQRQNLLRVTWRADKFRSVEFVLGMYYFQGKKLPRKVLFSKIRQSLAYGLNQRAREVTDILRKSNGETSAIHHMRRISSAL